MSRQYTREELLSEQSAFPSETNELGGYDLVLMSVNTEQKIDVENIEEFLKENKESVGKPILMKQGNEFIIYGLSEQGEWKLTRGLDASQLKKLSFENKPALTGAQEGKSLPKLRDSNNSYLTVGSELKIPGDNSCLFWSVAIGVLAPVLDDEKQYRLIFNNLFVSDHEDEQLFEKHSDGLKNRIQAFLRSNDTTLISKQGGQDPLYHLINWYFRQKVASYIDSHSLDFSSIIVGGAISEYVAQLRQVDFWGGDIEFRAIFKLLGENYHLLVENSSITLGDLNKPTIHTIHTNAKGKADGAKNHYNLRMPDIPVKVIGNSTSFEMSSTFIEHEVAPENKLNKIVILQNNQVPKEVYEEITSKKGHTQPGFIRGCGETQQLERKRNSQKPLTLLGTSPLTATPPTKQTKKTFDAMGFTPTQSDILKPNPLSPNSPLVMKFLAVKEKLGFMEKNISDAMTSASTASPISGSVTPPSLALLMSHQSDSDTVFQLKKTHTTCIELSQQLDEALEELDSEYLPEESSIARLVLSPSLGGFSPSVKSRKEETPTKLRETLQEVWKRISKAEAELKKSVSITTPGVASSSTSSNLDKFEKDLKEVAKSFQEIHDLLPSRHSPIRKPEKNDGYMAVEYGDRLETKLKYLKGVSKELLEAMQTIKSPLKSTPKSSDQVSVKELEEALVQLKTKADALAKGYEDYLVSLEEELAESKLSLRNTIKSLHQEKVELEQKNRIQTATVTHLEEEIKRKEQEKINQVAILEEKEKEIKQLQREKEEQATSIHDLRKEIRIRQEKIDQLTRLEQALPIQQEKEEIDQLTRSYCCFWRKAETSPPENKQLLLDSTKKKDETCCSSSCCLVM